MAIDIDKLIEERNSSLSKKSREGVKLLWDQTQTFYKERIELQKELDEMEKSEQEEIKEVYKKYSSKRTTLQGRLNIVIEKVRKGYLGVAAILGIDEEKEHGGGGPSKIRIVTIKEKT